MTNKISANGLFPVGAVLYVNGDGDLKVLGFLVNKDKQTKINIGDHEPFAISDREYGEAQEKVDANEKEKQENRDNFMANFSPRLGA